MRRVYYDVTHLRHNATRSMTSGIRRVDLEFADHFFLHRANTSAIQYGVAGPALLPGAEPLQRLIEMARAKRRQDSQGSELASIQTWLDGAPFRRTATRSHNRYLYSDMRSYLRFLSRPSSLDVDSIEYRSIYLNVAQHALGYGMFFRWLKARSDIRSVFFIHDLLPLDYPEFWRPGYQRGFQAGMQTLLELGKAYLVSSDAVKERLDQELRRHGRPDVPILSLPFPSLLDAGPVGDERSEALGRHPYFVMVGTIEPRKNHLLILNIWRRLAERGGAVPKLVIVGRRGWENEQVADMLDRCTAINDFVVEASAVSDAEMRKLVANARGLLFPSFSEGFGLPLAEALSFGTPVVASDIPVLHESSQEKALFLDPLDGPGWMAAILGLSDRSSPISVQARALAAEFRPSDPKSYFARLEHFLEDL